MAPLLRGQTRFPEWGVPNCLITVSPKELHAPGDKKTKTLRESTYLLPMIPLDLKHMASSAEKIFKFSELWTRCCLEFSSRGSFPDNANYRLGILPLSNALSAQLVETFLADEYPCCFKENEIAEFLWQRVNLGPWRLHQRDQNGRHSHLPWRSSLWWVLLQHFWVVVVEAIDWTSSFTSVLTITRWRIYPT